MLKNKLKKITDNDIAIKVDHLSKTFKVPHERTSSLKSAAINLFSSKSYEKFEALRDISFEIKKGEFFGIIGRNGSGKSTLLKMLAGIYIPDSGEISINGKLSPFLELGVGFNPELSGRENLYLGGAILGLTRYEVNQKFDQIVRFAELEEFIDMKLKNYSSGMQVRLAFTLAINAHAEILLMDEVLAVGDSNFQSKCMDEFGRYKKAGKTVVLVTHDIGTVARYCDRAMLIRDSQIQALGDANVVCNEYIKNNIKDEQSMPVSESETSHQAGDAVITGVSIITSDNIKKNTFSDEEFKIRINFNLKKVLESAVFGISIEDSAGAVIFGPNTKELGKDLGRITAGAGFVELELIGKELLSGTYYITAALFEGDGGIPLDYKSQIASFRVISKNNQQIGYVNLRHRWKV